MSAARSVLSRFRAYLRYRETVTELSRLSDRDLADLGINRFEIQGHRPRLIEPSPAADRAIARG